MTREFSPTYSMIITEDASAPRSGTQKAVTTTEIVENVQKLVLNDRRLKLMEMADTFWGR